MYVKTTGTRQGAVVSFPLNTEKGWLPISEERFAAIGELMKTVFKEAARKQADGYLDDWRERGFGELHDDLQEEVQEVQSDLFYVDHAKNLGIEDKLIAIANAQRECAHAALVLAFIYDNLNTMKLELNALELELMQENRKKNDS